MTVIVDAIIGSSTYRLTDLFTILSWQDIDHPPVTRLTEQGPNQQGDTDVDFRLQPRTFSMVLMVKSNQAWSDVWSARTSLINVFKASHTQLSLRFTFDSGAVRQIDCVVAGPMKMDRDGTMGFTQKAGIMFRAANPLFYDPTSQTLTLPGSSGNGFAVPLTVPMNVGLSAVATSLIVTNVGSWDAYPILVLAGPISNPVITNNASGDKLDFTGLTLSGGQYYTIDCRYDHKTIIDQASANQISKLVSGSSLTTFRLLADPDAPAGYNNISLTGTGVNQQTYLSVQYQPNYIGI